MVSAPIVDQTNLTGGFDLKLEWTPQLSSSSSNQPEVSIFTALREQMGLRLDRIPTTIDVVIVDSVNRMPIEN
jgi:uncharacterized protein (TIGR03435 family)